MSPRAAFAGLLAALVALGAAALWIGPGDASPLRVLQAAFNGGGDSEGSRLATAILLDLRLPRVLLSACVGAALGIAGAVSQGVFRNPMAAPDVLGISVGAAAAAVLAIVLRLDEAGPAALPLTAALGAVAAALLLRALAGPSADAVTLLLSGVAMSALFGAVLTLLLAVHSQRWEVGGKVLRWLMGSLEGRSWDALAAVAVIGSVGAFVAFGLARDLDALTLGEDTAASLGVDASGVQWRAVVAVSLLVGAVTAVCGVIGFLGLVVPHVTRRLLGGGHRVLLPGSALLGAVAMVVVDVVTRGSHGLALPPGAVTSLLGAPFFLWLLRRGRTPR
jgi:iron complex transport system permease protein